MDQASDRGPDDHLRSEELAGLYERARHAPPWPHDADLHPHLAGCPSCQQRFHDYLFQSEQLLQLRSGGPVLRQSDCPSGTVWREIAAALLPPDAELDLIQHASRCDHCGILLREAIADLNGEVIVPETTLIASLNSARPWWQRRLALRITGRLPASVPGWKFWIHAPRLAMAGTALMAATAMAVGVWIATRPTPAAEAASLLASAYTEQRPLQLRIAGARYAPPNLRRGPEGSLVGRPSALLKAEALIADRLASHPFDPTWLQAKARADLLDGKYEAALESLKHALQIEPKSSDILIDLGTAYFQQKDYGAAYESLSQALALKPNDPLALFNRAAVAEQLYLYRQASDDWERFLQVDPGSDWAGEAREGLERVRAKLKAHDGQSKLLTPSQLVTSAGDPNLGSAIDARVEDYLQEAVRSWLPTAFPENSPPKGRDRTDAPAAAQALFFLADLTRQQHDDGWLSDLLHGSSAPSFPQAIAALARAAEANDGGEYDTTRDQAARAENLFRASGNVAGALRAQFERTFADQISRHSEACRQQAKSALAESERYHYAWLHIQLGLEEGVCSVLMGDYGAYDRTAHRAMDLAQRSGYGALYLRALYFASGDKFDTGDRPAAWQLNRAGLDLFWSGQFPAMRGFNLYSNLAYAAESEGRPNLQIAMWREAVEVLGSNRDLLLQAIAHKLQADAAAEAHLPELAEREYAEAMRLYALAPRTDASRSDAIENGIRTAQLEARERQFDRAIARLTSLQEQVRPLSNNYLAQMFYSTLGELQLDRQRAVESEQALRPALALAEQSLASIHSETERISWSRNAAPVYLGLAAAELEQGRQQESLEMYEWYLGASQRAAADRQPHRTLTNLPVPEPPPLSNRLLLLSHETVLAYAALPGGLAIWVCDDRGVYGQWIAMPTGELQQLAARFYDISSDPKSDLNALRRDGRSLYQSLIAPVEGRLIAGRMIVLETDGWLAQVPFEALVDSDNHYLIERWPVVHSLGQESEARLRRDVPISAGRLALVVASTASSQEEGLLPLIDVDDEADTVARGFQSARVLKGSEATLSAVQKNLPGAAVFHFAGHSLTTPERAGLMLESSAGRTDPSPDVPSLLDAAAVHRLDLDDLQLAVLSACNTGSDAGGANGANSVTEAFLRAGVPHVIASRWAVVDAHAFVDSFYRNALAGQPVSEAIRTASRSMVADPRTAHPYYWSAFSAYGRP